MSYPIPSPIASAISSGIGGSGGGNGAYTTTASDGDGSNDYFKYDPTTPAEFVSSNKGVISVFVRIDGGDGTIRHIWRREGGLGFITFNSSNKIWVRLYDTSNTLQVEFTSTPAYTAGASWICITLAWDTSDATSTNNWCYLYVGDTQIGADTDIAQSTIQLNDATFAKTGLMGRDTGQEKFNGCFCELFLHGGANVNPSVEADRRKFISADGKPVDKGADGSTPLGVQPAYYSKDGTATNLGSAADPTLVGALDPCSSSPTD